MANKKIAELRKSLGLTQEFMAPILGMSRSAYANFEADKRMIRTSSFLQLAEIEKILNRVNAEPPPEWFDVAAEEKSLKKWMLNQEYALAAELSEAKKKLHKMEAFYQRTLQVLACYHAELEQPVQQVLDPSVIRMARTNLLRKLAKNNLLHQVRLRMEIASKEAKLTFVREFNAGH